MTRYISLQESIREQIAKEPGRAFTGVPGFFDVYRDSFRTLVRREVYRVRPSHELLRSGEAPSQEGAEEAGKKALAAVIRQENRPTA